MKKIVVSSLFYALFLMLGNTQANASQQIDGLNMGNSKGEVQKGVKLAGCAFNPGTVLDSLKDALSKY